MAGPVLAVAWAALAFVLYRITAYVREELRHKRNAKRLGCEQPSPMRDEWWNFLGILGIVTVMKAFKANRLPQFQKERVERVQEREGRRVTTFSNVSVSRLLLGRGVEGSRGLRYRLHYRFEELIPAELHVSREWRKVWAKGD